MATVYYTRIPGTPLTDEQKQRLEALKNFDEKFDDPECPPMTDEQLDQMDRIMRRYNTRRITKEMILEDRRLQAEGRL